MLELLEFDDGSIGCLDHFVIAHHFAEVIEQLVIEVKFVERFVFRLRDYRLLLG